MNKKFNFRVNLLSFIISLISGIIIFGIIFFSSVNQSIRVALDSSTIAGFCLICVAILIWISDLGFFDFAKFGFKQMGNMLSRTQFDHKYTYIEYRDEQAIKRSKKSSFVPGIIVAGLLFVLLIIIFEIMIH